MLAPEVRRGRVGIKIVSLSSGNVIFENDADKYFMPASNMKNFTIATAMERLGPDFKFKTDVLAYSPIDNGTIRGPLVIKGGGDVSISNAFDPGFPGVVNPYWGIDKLVDKITAAGVKRIDGDLIGNEQRFTGFAVPETWEWDDMETFSGAEVSALPLNDNVVDLRVMPATSGSQCLIAITPANPLIKIVNNCMTTTEGGQKIKVTKSINQNVIEVTGIMQTGGKDMVQSITFSHVAELFMNILKERLEARGVVITGKARTVDNSYENMRSPSGRPFGNLISPDKSQTGPITLTSLESPPFSVIAAKTMKPSQNMYTETILWTLGEYDRPYFDPIKTSASQVTIPDSAHLGLNVVKSFLGSIGLPPESVLQYDGSGMSRHDQITPDAIIRLYTYMAKQSKYAQVWLNSLSIGGVDGTLRNRYKGTSAEGNMRGKTGTLDQVSALSGYVTTAAGEKVIVSIIVNGVPKTLDRTSLADDIVISIANFNGKID